MPVITSLHNDRVKLIRALQSSGKSRRKENRIALEGVRLIGDALSQEVAPDFVFYTADVVDDQAGDQPGSRLLRVLQERSITCIEVVPDVMAHMAETQTPQGIIAVVPMPNVPVPSQISLTMILDGVADPGNLGTILRTAAAAGVDIVILAPGCVDAYNPKVLRGGMGAHFRVPILRKSWADIAREFSEQNPLPLYLADAKGDAPYYAVDWAGPAGLIIGGEAHGPDEQARQLAKQKISIPMENRSESLNAAVAAGVILFEVRRQRVVGQ